MAKQSLQRHVEGRFGMRLDEFIRYAHQVELRNDAETADILNVNSALIGRLRKKFGIKRADRFSRRFRTTYGEDALEVFHEMIERAHASLSDVAGHFGFSRQYASDVYKKIYGRRFREARREQRMAKNRSLAIEPVSAHLDKGAPNNSLIFR